MFYSNNEGTGFDANIKNNDAFKYFKYKTKLNGNADFRTLENVTLIAVTLKYQHNVLQSL